MTSHPYTPPLLRLPLELRQQIYTHLLPRSPTSHPLPSIGITSVTHAPPAPSLLSIHPQLTSEITSFYYALATFTLIFSHAFNFFRVDPQLLNLEESHVIKRMRKVEVVFYCDNLLLCNLTGSGVARRTGMEEEVRRKADRAVEVLEKAEELKMVAVSWIDTGHPGPGGDEARKKILTPLRRLREKVAFRVGRVYPGHSLHAGVAADRMAFAQMLVDMLYGDVDGTIKKNMLRLDGAKEVQDPDPSRLRLLAFDPRQDRNLYREAISVSSSARSRLCVATTGSPGWHPPVLS